MLLQGLGVKDAVAYLATALAPDARTQITPEVLKAKPDYYAIHCWYATTPLSKQAEATKPCSCYNLFPRARGWALTGRHQEARARITDIRRGDTRRGLPAHNVSNIIRPAEHTPMPMAPPFSSTPPPIVHACHRPPTPERRL